MLQNDVQFSENFFLASLTPTKSWKIQGYQRKRKSKGLLETSTNTSLRKEPKNKGILG